VGSGGCGERGRSEIVLCLMPRERGERKQRDHRWREQAPDQQMAGTLVAGHE
jgi:hypothetical protein